MEIKEEVIMYNLFYCQQFVDETQAPLRVNLAYENLGEAISRFHSELAQVGINSNLSRVNAMIYDDSCNIIKTGMEQIIVSNNQE